MRVASELVEQPSQSSSSRIVTLKHERVYLEDKKNMTTVAEQLKRKFLAYTQVWAVKECKFLRIV